jgi:hypothetical protein
MSIIDDAIVKLQTHALALTTPSMKIRSAPSHPVEDASVLPLAIAHIVEGSGQADEATTARLLLTVGVDFHLSRTSLKNAYSEIDKIIPEFLQRLAGDPTLGSTVDTIVFPVTFTVTPADWGSVVTQAVFFRVPLKFREDPIT